MKFALSTFPERYTLPGRPSGASPAQLDAHKQTQFLLGDELALFERAMNLQLLIVAANRKARTPPAAGLYLFWSRTFSHLADACTLICSGSYTSSPPLLRATLDCIAAQRALIREDFGEYEEWFATAASQMKEHQALAFNLGRYRAGSVLAEDPELGPLYRLLTDLSMPHFGSTALMVGPESGLERIAIAFADSAFHLAWGQLTAGWAILLAGVQLRTIIESGVFELPDGFAAEAERVGQESERLLTDRRRGRVEEVDGRFLFHNFRRTASGQPRRLML
jgi:hypothetical protein